MWSLLLYRIYLIYPVLYVAARRRVSVRVPQRRMNVLINYVMCSQKIYSSQLAEIGAMKNIQQYIYLSIELTKKIIAVARVLENTAAAAASSPPPPAPAATVWPYKLYRAAPGCCWCVCAVVAYTLLNGQGLASSQGFVLFLLCFTSLTHSRAIRSKFTSMPPRQVTTTCGP